MWKRRESFETNTEFWRVWDTISAVADITAFQHTRIVCGAMSRENIYIREEFQQVDSQSHANVGIKNPSSERCLRLELLIGSFNLKRSQTLMLISQQ